MQIFVANKLTTIFPLLHNRVVKEQKMACPSNTPYTILKDGIALLEHEACQEQPLDLLGTFKKRNPAMGTPNLCGFYYRMTDFVASQLYHLSDIIKANSAIRGSNLHRHSEVVRGWRTMTKFKKNIFRTNMFILNVKCSQGKLVFNVRLQVLLTTPLSSML